MGLRLMVRGAWALFKLFTILQLDTLAGTPERSVPAECDARASTLKP